MNIFLDENKINLYNFFYVDENYSKDHIHMVHSHKTLELLYIYSGYGRYFVGNREYAVNKGDIIICNANILHGESPLQKHTMQTYCCSYDNVKINNLPINTLTFSEEKPLLVLSPKQVQDFNVLMPMIYNHFNKENTIIAKHLALSLLHLLYNEILTHRKTKTNQSEQKNDNLVRNISAFIDDNYKESITLEKISKKFHISPSRLSHVFKEETGLSPIQYAIHRRIGEAQTLLIETDSPIQDIEESLGFCSSVHFCMMFKKYIGITPKNYRQHFKKSYTNNA